MKQLFFVILFATVFSCQSSLKNKIDKTETDSSLSPEDVVSNNMDSQQDSIFIIPEAGDTLFYSKEDFDTIKNTILDRYGYINHPDILASQLEFFAYTDRSGQPREISFSCEVCKDRFFETYAYILRSKNGIKKYSIERKKLIEAFRLINEIYDLLRRGTYYGHQYSRILGYAEYAIYKLADYNEYYQRKYDITKQKDLYINLLKQEIRDEIDNDNNNGLTNDYKSKLKSDLFELADNLKKIITDYFSLKSLQEFQYSNY